MKSKTTSTMGFDQLSEPQSLSQAIPAQAERNSSQLKVIKETVYKMQDTANA